jgi:PAS domain S-box-containing protein
MKLHSQSELLQAANDAALLLCSDEENLEEQAALTLERMALATQADVITVWRNHGNAEENLQCTRVFRWMSAHAAKTLPVLATTISYRDDMPEWALALAAGQSVNTAASGPSKTQRGHPGDPHTPHALIVPILFRASFWGFIRMARIEPTHAWGVNEENLLRSVGLLLAATMQRRQMQDALSLSGERFRDVTEAAGELIWEIDAYGYCSYISDRAFDVLGYESAEVLGRRIEDFASAGEDETSGRMLQAGVAQGGIFRHFEHRVRTKDGRDIWLLSSGRVLIGPDGIAGLRGTSLDITKSKEDAARLHNTLEALETANSELEISIQSAHELTRKAEEANRAKSNFLANISHEIRTPLNAVIGMAYLLQKGELSPQQKTYADKIYSGSRALLDIVLEILDFSHIESGQMQIKCAPYELGELLENLAALVDDKAEGRNLKTAFIIAPDVPLRLVGDAKRLAQALTSITDNAIKFTERGGAVLRCSLDRIEEETAILRFVISDTGIGIAQDQMDTLFQSFSQVDGSSTRSYGGTGLGLALAKRLVTLLGGELSLDSTHGKGTTVTITVPQTIDRNACQARQEPALFFASHSLACQDLEAVLMDNSDQQRERLLELMLKQGGEQDRRAHDRRKHDRRSGRSPDTTVAAVAPATVDAATPGSGLAAAAGPDLQKPLQRLLKLLADDDAAACQLFTSLEPRLTAIDHHAVAAAGKALAVFDFSEARTLLVPVFNSLKTVCSERESS